METQEQINTLSDSKEYNELRKELDRTLDNLKVEFEEFYLKENAAAGLRLRKGLKSIKETVVAVSKSTLPKNNKK